MLIRSFAWAGGGVGAGDGVGAGARPDGLRGSIFRSSRREASRRPACAPGCWGRSRPAFRGVGGWLISIIRIVRWRIAETRKPWRWLNRCTLRPAYPLPHDRGRVPRAGRRESTNPYQILELERPTHNLSARPAAKLSVRRSAPGSSGPGPAPGARPPPRPAGAERSDRPSEGLDLEPERLLVGGALACGLDAGLPRSLLQPVDLGFPGA